jgi:prophage antirepressor-like protein
MTKLARFLFGVEDALTITTRTKKGQSWYMAADICRLVGIANHSTAVHGERTDGFELEKSEWLKNAEYTGTSKRQILMVNNSGMVKLIMQGTTGRAREVQVRAQQQRG